MSVNKLERLLNLTAVLLNTSRPLSADELRQKVEGYPPPGAAFHRAFERDKDDLRVLGVPLKVERVPATDPPVDGYRIDPEEYYLPDPDLEGDELAALHLASLTVRLDGLDDQEALWKLGGLGATDSPGLQGDEVIGVGQMVASIPTDPGLVPIFQAISEGASIVFVYGGTERELDPWRLDFHRGRWYLTGYDRLREDERNFRLDRIEGEVRRSGQPIVHLPKPATSEEPRRPWEVGADEPTVASLLVDASRVAGARRQLGDHVQIDERPDGSAVFTVPVTRYDAFRYFVLGFMEFAELLEPAEWRQDIITWLEAIVVRHEASTESPA